MPSVARATTHQPRLAHQRRPFDARAWKFRRLAYFKRTVSFAARAKAYRMAKGVLVVEVAKAMGFAAGTVSNWESGKYGWQQGEEELAEYKTVIDKLAAS